MGAVKSHGRCMMRKSLELSETSSSWWVDIYILQYNYCAMLWVLEKSHGRWCEWSNSQPSTFRHFQRLVLQGEWIYCRIIIVQFYVYCKSRGWWWKWTHRKSLSLSESSSSGEWIYIAVSLCNVMGAVQFWQTLEGYQRLVLQGGWIYCRIIIVQCYGCCTFRAKPRTWRTKQIRWVEI